MVVEVFMPKMTDNMSVGVVLNWLVKDGEYVERGQPIMEVETDKATMELEAPDSGIVKGIRIGVTPGTEVPVGEVIAFIVDDPAAIVPNLPPFGDTADLVEGEVAGVLNADQVPVTESLSDDKNLLQASPLVRRMARELKINLAQVKGTGPDGRITKEDILSFAEPSSLAESQPDVGREEDWLELNHTQILTGRRLVESLHTAPQFAITVSVDMTHVLQMREALSAQIEAETGANLSVTGILVKIVAEALMAYPRANASFVEDRIRLHRHVNIGVAVGTIEGLVVPVIHNANNKSLAQIALELKTFREKAKLMRFSVDDLTGGTFTISNIGMLGIEQFQAIINPPESAILAIGQILKTPVGMPNDTIALRPMMKMTLTVDHRSLDGVLAAEFLSLIKQGLQQTDLRS